MAALQLFSLFLLFLMIFFFHPTRGYSICPASNCPGGPPVRFPFWLRNLQSPRCGYNNPGFDLSCSNQTPIMTTLTLPASSDNFIVQGIDYEFQTLYINDPNHCLPKRLLDNTFNLHGTPFHVDRVQNLTFLNCSSLAGASHAMSIPVATIIFHAMSIPVATIISCFSTENHTVLAVPSGEYENWLQSMSSSSASLSPSPSPSPSEVLCPVISSVMVPTTAADEMPDLFGHVGHGVVLTWSTPDRRDCEACGGDCGFNRDADRIVCSNIPKAKSEGLPRSAKYGIIIGVGIPGLLCIIGLASCAFGRIKAHTRRHQPSMDLSTLASRQPTFVTIGLDGPTIQSYPKTLLGESKRLPKPNDNTCSICLSEYEAMEALRTIPECNHYFHASCIDEWLKMNATCPVCRNSPEGSSVATHSSSMSSSTFSIASP
ncbi:RING-H2 finger protein ATL20-like [Pyrus ussuriensis x Pyrus communis]|uniref:RING-type E3 ubiquitin transferase n=1 Tax=Pyrus ussuriensis x Pyrus communis TaxID=2448454 RepID=A0A5N5GZK9_9ROSA|nr:RING-H2 finger protein ATL20-like [Pyrus ussuriensis x Pyrus communis]